MLWVNPFTIFGDKSGKNQLTDLSDCIFILSHSKFSFPRIKINRKLSQETANCGKPRDSIR